VPWRQARRPVATVACAALPFVCGTLRTQYHILPHARTHHHGFAAYHYTRACTRRAAHFAHTATFHSFGDILGSSDSAHALVAPPLWIPHTLATHMCDNTLYTFTYCLHHPLPHHIPHCTTTHHPTHTCAYTLLPLPHTPFTLQCLLWFIPACPAHAHILGDWATRAHWYAMLATTATCHTYPHLPDSPLWTHATPARLTATRPPPTRHYPWHTTAWRGMGRFSPCNVPSCALPVYYGLHRWPLPTPCQCRANARHLATARYVKHFARSGDDGLRWGGCAHGTKRDTQTVPGTSWTGSMAHFLYCASVSRQHGSFDVAAWRAFTNQLYRTYLHIVT